MFTIKTQGHIFLKSQRKKVNKAESEIIFYFKKKAIEKLEKSKKFDIIDISSILDPEHIEQEMKKAAKELDFERAMELRDILFELKTK